MGIFIRRAEAADASEISELILGVSRYSTVDPSGTGAERFFATLTPTAIAGYVTDPGFDYFVACEASKIVAVGAVRQPRHLYHLFVRESCRGRGLARQLWQELYARIEARGEGTVTVNSTVYAVPVYERFGFVVSGPTVEKDGIAFIPMELKSTAPSQR